MSQAQVTEAFRLLVGNAGLTWDDLEDLSTDPATLEAFVRDKLSDRDGTDPDDTAVVNMLVNLIVAPAPPELRMAAWTVASGLPGAVVTSGATGSRGQAGTLFEHHGNGYLFDPTSGLLLEYTSRDARVIHLEQYVTDQLPDGAPQR